ncbi:MAG: hypothetical protein WD036_05995 [Bauldia sp.]
MTMSQGPTGLGQSAANVPNGPGAAAILAAGIGCAALGILALTAETSSTVHDLMNFYGPVGPLSGKTTVAIVVWLVAWYALSRLWRAKTVKMGAVNGAAFILLGIGFLLTFPPVWRLFL